MNLFHLKYFVDAARGGGVSASARANFVTQSAVSRAIGALEGDLGVELIIHRQNHFQLTEAGEAVAATSDEILDSVSRLRDAASAHLKTFRGPLRLGCNQAIASRLVAPALARMQSRYPGIRPDLRLGNTDQIQQMLDRREADFGIVVDDGEVESVYETRKVFTDQLLVVKSPKFRARDPFDSLMVSRTRKGGLSERYFREYKKVHGEAPAPKLVVPSWQVILDLALAGYGAALVPRFLCDDALRSKKLELVRTKVRPLTFDLCTIVGRNRALPKNAQAFFEFFGNSSAPRTRS